MTEQDILLLRKWIHDLNNRVGTILATAELLQMEQLSSKAADRSKVIELKALELRAIIRQISDHYVQ
jgi:hypothetical protein